jgi:hypothetical protein
LGRGGSPLFCFLKSTFLNNDFLSVCKGINTISIILFSSSNGDGGEDDDDWLMMMIMIPPQRIMREACRPVSLLGYSNQKIVETTVPWCCLFFTVDTTTTPARWFVLFPLKRTRAWRGWIYLLVYRAIGVGQIIVPSSFWFSGGGAKKRDRRGWYW